MEICTNDADIVLLARNAWLWELGLLFRLILFAGSGQGFFCFVTLGSLIVQIDECWSRDEEEEG